MTLDNQNPHHEFFMSFIMCLVIGTTKLKGGPTKWVLYYSISKRSPFATVIMIESLPYGVKFNNLSEYNIVLKIFKTTLINFTHN